MDEISSLQKFSVISISLRHKSSLNITYKKLIPFSYAMYIYVLWMFAPRIYLFICVCMFVLGTHMYGFQWVADYLWTRKYEIWLDKLSKNGKFSLKALELDPLNVEYCL